MGSAVSAGVGVPMGAGVPIASFKFAHRAHSGASWEYYDDATSAMIADAMARQPAGGSSRLSNPALPFEVRWGTMTTGGNIVQVNLNSGNTRIVKKDEAASAGASPGVGARFSHQGPDGKWEPYSADVCAMIENAQLTQPAGGVVGLPGIPFEVRWGDRATSQKMTKSPTGMMQVNVQSGNTRIVRMEAGPPPAATGIPVPSANPSPPQPSQGVLTPIAEFYLGNGSKFILAGGSVIDYVGDAVVNAANEGCVGGFGVDEMINQAGGPRLRAARQQLGGCPTGFAKSTQAFDHKNTNFIIHAVGPVYRVDPHKHGFAPDSPHAEAYMKSLDHLLRDAYRSSLTAASKVGARSLGFCLLSAGVFRGTRPLGDVVEIAIRTLTHALHSDPTASIAEVTLVAFTTEEQAVMERLTRLVGAEVAAGGDGAGDDVYELYRTNGGAPVF